MSRRKRKNTPRNYAVDYYNAFNNIKSMMDAGQLPHVNLVAMVNNGWLLMNTPNTAINNVALEDMAPDEQDVFFKRKNEYALINKVLNKVMNDLVNGNPISETFDCEIRDYQAMNSAMYKLTTIIMFAILPLYQQANGGPYHYLRGAIQTMIDGYYYDVKDDDHLEQSFRDPTMDKILEPMVGDTAEQRAQLEKYSSTSAYSHDFKIYNRLVQLESYTRTVILKHFPKNAAKTLVQNSEGNLIQGIELLMLANKENNIRRRITMLAQVVDYIQMFIVDMDISTQCGCTSFNKYFNISKEKSEIERMMVSLINKLQMKLDRGQEYLFDNSNKPQIALQKPQQQTQVQQQPVQQNVQQTNTAVQYQQQPQQQKVYYQQPQQQTQVQQQPVQQTNTAVQYQQPQQQQTVCYQQPQQQQTQQKVNVVTIHDRPVADPQTPPKQNIVVFEEGSQLKQFVGPLVEAITRASANGYKVVNKKQITQNGRNNSYFVSKNANGRRHK